MLDSFVRCLIYDVQDNGMNGLSGSEAAASSYRAEPRISSQSECAISHDRLRVRGIGDPSADEAVLI